MTMAAQTEKILLDTDIGSDIDDAVALAYLLRQPRCELMGITTVSGEPDQRAMLASAILKAAGREDIPIYPGAPEAMLGVMPQKKAQQAAKLPNWPHETTFPQGEAIVFMRRTIEQNPGEITLLAIGPMTNAGLLLAQDPAIAAKLKRIVLMNGSFFHTLPTAWINEWNSLNDPTATAIVYNAHAPVHRSVGLDVTMQVQMPAKEVRARFNDPVLAPVKDFADVWFEQTPVMTFHDPLAAVSIFEDDLLTYERGNVEIELLSPRLRGFTHFTADPAGRHEAARAVDPQKFFDAFFRVFQ